MHGRHISKSESLLQILHLFLVERNAFDLALHFKLQYFDFATFFRYGI